MVMMGESSNLIIPKGYTFDMKSATGTIAGDVVIYNLGTLNISQNITFNGIVCNAGTLTRKTISDAKKPSYIKFNMSEGSAALIVNKKYSCENGEKTYFFGEKQYMIIYVAVLVLYFFINHLIVRRLKKLVPADVLKNRE